MTAVNACKLVFLSISTYQLSTAEGATSASQSYPNLALVTSPHCLHRAGGALQKIPSKDPERHSSRARWFHCHLCPLRQSTFPHDEHSGQLIQVPHNENLPLK